MKWLGKSMPILAAVLLAGCIGGSPTEDVTAALEATAEKEAEIQDIEPSLSNLETTEQDLFNDILAKSMEQFDEVESLADDALANLDQRQEQLTAEQGIMNEAKEEFDQVKDLAGELEDEEQTEQLEAMIEEMDSRYQLHNDFVAAYEEGLELDRELYTMLKNEELSLEELESQVASVNSTYETIVTLNDEFNASTDRYNELKSAFYDTVEAQEE